MPCTFKEFIASILILEDNVYDRQDLASLGKTLEQAEKLPQKSVVSKVQRKDDEIEEGLKQLETSS